MTGSCHFYLDECLPHQVADALKLVEFPIECADSNGWLGWKDKRLLPELVRCGLTWITKDDDARRRHLASDPLRSQLSVIWVRGFDRRSDPMSPRQFHHLLTNCLDKAEVQVTKAKSALWFEVYFNGAKPTLSPLNRQGVVKRRHKRDKRARR